MTVIVYKHHGFYLLGANVLWVARLPSKQTEVSSILTVSTKLGV